MLRANLDRCCRPLRRAAVWAASVLGVLVAADLRADIVKLKSGGEVRGVVRPADAKARRDATAADEVVLETLTGAELAVASNQVAFVTKRPRVVEEYESQARHVADTVEARWSLAEWCRQHGLVEPRKEQLQRLLELDPEHKPAHYGLGHRRQADHWISPEAADAELLAAGYVRYKGKVITTLERDLLETGATRHREQNDWRPRIRLWLGWLNGRDARRQADALVKFRELRDPDAVPAIADFLLSDSNVDVRGLAVQTLSQIGGPMPVPALARVALSDADYVLRNTAFESLSYQQRSIAAPLFERALKDGVNAIVLRAASLLGRLGLRKAVPALIEALITSHTTKVPVRQGISAGFNRDGSTGTSGGLPPDVMAGLLTGQYPNGLSIQQSGPQPSVKWVTIHRPQQNLA